MLCRTAYSQILQRVYGDRFDRLGVVAGGGSYHECVSPVGELAAGKSQNVVVAYGATGR